jgi:hypothetical protein
MLEVQTEEELAVIVCCVISMINACSIFYNSNLRTVPKLTNSCVYPSSCKIQGAPGGKAKYSGSL